MDSIRNESTRGMLCVRRLEIESPHRLRGFGQVQGSSVVGVTP